MKRKNNYIRETLIFKLHNGREVITWKIHETRTHRWYCYDEKEFSFAWSFIQKRAIERLKEWAKYKGFTVLRYDRHQSVIVTS